MLIESENSYTIRLNKDELKTLFSVLFHVRMELMNNDAKDFVINLRDQIDIINQKTRIRRD